MRGLGVPVRRLGQLGQFGCLVHLTHFDSVFGLSTVPESLNEHYSSPNIFSKKKILKNQIFEKSNKIRQNFRKIKVSKMKFLLIKNFKI